MTTFLTHVLNELEAGHDGPEIPEAKRVYFQRRLRDRFFDFLRERFEREEANGLTQAKLARRIGKSPEVISRWLNTPSNLTLDSISDLMIGVAAEEPKFEGNSLLNRPESNYSHLVEFGDEDQCRYCGAPPPAGEVERLRRALNEIDALDPEEHSSGCSADALRGLVIRMGEIARAALNGGLEKGK